MSYIELDKNIENLIKTERKNGTYKRVECCDNSAIRRFSNPHDQPSIIRSNFIKDVDKILNLPFYNRYGDKTQVFSFYRNDDISRRFSHVQLVSRIARTIGKALNLNLELIEAISLGHDLGHPPFGHSGEVILDKLFYSQTKRHFSHAIQSVRILTDIFPQNLTLQTLSGIASHNGEIEQKNYQPKPLESFDQFDKLIEECYVNDQTAKKLVPSTLEGCLVKICDIIAYIGKDRQDAQKINLVAQENFTDQKIGLFNAEIINNLMVNLIENSYGKPYVCLSDEFFTALKSAKEQNYKLIYAHPQNVEIFNSVVNPMFEMVYFKLLSHLKNKNQSSPIFTHHVNLINNSFYSRSQPYGEGEPNQIVVDFIASMTDDYFLDLFHHLFPDSNLKVEFKGYFD